MARKRGLEKERKFEKIKYTFSKSDSYDGDEDDQITNFENLIEDIDRKFRFRKNANNIPKKVAPCEQRKRHSQLLLKDKETKMDRFTKNFRDRPTELPPLPPHNGSLKETCFDRSKLPPPPPPPPPCPPNPSTSAVFNSPSQPRLSQEIAVFQRDSFSDDEFEEDEVVMCFDEEEGDLKVFEEFPGEDYSKYLADEEISTENEIKDKKKKRKKKRRLKLGSLGQKKKVIPPPPSKEEIERCHTDSEVTRTRRFKQRITQLVAWSLTDKKQEARHKLSLQKFTFADSKAGQTDDSDDENRRHSGKWWHKETLAAESLENHPEVLLKERKENEVQRIRPKLPAPPPPPMRDVAQNNFESKRRHTLLNEELNHIPQKNAKDTLVRRLVKKFRKSLLEKEANLTINPLNNLSPSEYGDIAL
ncbi:DgyrCDS3135 [Dimorphilus gyrociliatus]|uniref:DgyrCDS3135 n=1 Tax=Dimorphilus gyrociliatus TaxID=2664684 RepID=A0A7I8VCN6_9ANNE|nr:DgyrCDS3135 [Dimorphilus gyrociliatus]